jgi:hypothetical protein
MFANQLIKSRYGCFQPNTKHMTFDFFNNKSYPRLIDIDSCEMRLNYSLASISCKDVSDSLLDLNLQEKSSYPFYETKNLEYQPFIKSDLISQPEKIVLEKKLSIDDHIITIDATKDVLVKLPSKSFQDKEYIIKRVYGSKNIIINSENKNISPLNTVDLTNNISLGTKPNTTILIYNELNGGIWLQIQ